MINVRVEDDTYLFNVEGLMFPADLVDELVAVSAYVIDALANAHEELTREEIYDIFVGDLKDRLEADVEYEDQDADGEEK